MLPVEDWLEIVRNFDEKAPYADSCPVLKIDRALRQEELCSIETGFFEELTCCRGLERLAGLDAAGDRVPERSKRGATMGEEHFSLRPADEEDRRFANGFSDRSPRG